MKENWKDKVRKAVTAFLDEPLTKYVTIITLTISILLLIQAYIDGTEPNGRFLSLADKQLAINFVEWFGVLYGFLLPTILVRVWEQFDQIDNVLDREADAIKSLVGDLMLLEPQHEDFRNKVLRGLYKYCKNVHRFLQGKRTHSREIKAGERILKEIRGCYVEIFRKGNSEKQGSDVLKDELLKQLNDIIDNRGDRISLSTQRLFESLNFIAVITSIVWLVPFYFLYFQNEQTGEALQLGVFGWLLVICVTFIIIIILSIIDDLDKPFDGFWAVNVSSWVDLVAYIKEEYKKTRGAKIVPQETPAQEREVDIPVSAAAPLQSLPFHASSPPQIGLQGKSDQAKPGVHLNPNVFLWIALLLMELFRWRSICLKKSRKPRIQ